MKNRLTVKQKLFVNEYIKTKNGTKAAMRVYDVKNKNTAKVIASQNLTKTNIRESIEKCLQAQGYNPRSSVQTLIEIQDMPSNKHSSSDRIRASELLLKLSGHLVEKSQTVSTNYTFDQRIDHMSYEELLEFNNKYNKLRNRPGEETK